MSNHVADGAVLTHGDVPWPVPGVVIGTESAYRPAHAEPGHDAGATEIVLVDVRPQAEPK